MPEHFDVRYTAQLARLRLSDEEAAKFQIQISQILEYVEKLAQVDVSHVEPTAHASAIYNVFRTDEIAAARELQSGEALANAPRQANRLFIVPKVVE